MDHGQRHEPDPGTETKSRVKWVFIGFLVVAAYFLVTEHRAHALGWLSSYGIWLLLLACPLMHLFMHGGHGGHGSHRDDGDAPSDGRSKGKRP